MRAMIECLLLLVATLRVSLRARADLAAENLLLRHQLAVLTRPTLRRPRLRIRDRLLWVLAGLARRDWRHHLLLVKPETVIRWHRRGWRLFWRWRSRSSGGRPRLGLETRDLIRSMSRDNVLWGTEGQVGFHHDERRMEARSRRGKTGPLNTQRRPPRPDCRLVHGRRAVRTSMDLRSSWRLIVSRTW
jgi:hypothetical protein